METVNHKSKTFSNIFCAIIEGLVLLIMNIALLAYVICAEPVIQFLILFAAVSYVSGII